MSSDFRVGDEVVCVNASNDVPGIAATSLASRHLELNKVYVISAMKVTVKNLPLVLVQGLDGWWAAARFRKVQKKFTGMTVLHAMLLTQPALPELVH